MTKQRKLVLDVLVASHSHLTADEIYSLARLQMPDIALGTVYRNLGVLVDNGDVLKIDVPGEASRYDGNVFPHEHIACTVCGRVDDVTVDGLKPFLMKNREFDIDGYSLVLYHVCENCRKNGKF